MKKDDIKRAKVRAWQIVRRQGMEAGPKPGENWSVRVGKYKWDWNRWKNDLEPEEVGR